MLARREQRRCAGTSAPRDGDGLDEAIALIQAARVAEEAEEAEAVEAVEAARVAEGGGGRRRHTQTGRGVQRVIVEVVNCRAMYSCIAVEALHHAVEVM